MDLTTTYMGMALKNPLVPSASPISHTLDGIRKAEDAGAAAVVMYSLFEEQLKKESEMLDHFLDYNDEAYAEMVGYFPKWQDFKMGPDAYLDLIRRAKEATEIPIIGSLNGISTGGWVEHAKLIEAAGADGIELNEYYIPANPDITGAEVEKMYVDLVRAVKANVSIPVAVKLSPFFSATANMAKQLAGAGADALVLFNRFYQPDIDLEELEVVPNLILSESNEMRLPLRWVAILYGQVDIDFALTTGVHTYRDVLKGLMAGANVTMMASVLLHMGVEHVGVILREMEEWMEANEYESVKQMQGSMSQKNVAEPSAFERANYMKVLQSWKPEPTGKAI
ncbi:MAG: dihydroorotate dehydrogenase-like protein [Anaerolineae bacterium]|nr:dihydroorotate dehydrogenase-like protein [Anaerolineae bacterium]